MKEQDEDHRLKFISGGLLSTAELSIMEAQKEIQNFAERCHRMFGFVTDLLQTGDEVAFNKTFSRIEKYENITDSMEMEIAAYLNKVSRGPTVGCLEDADSEDAAPDIGTGEHWRLGVSTRCITLGAR